VTVSGTGFSVITPLASLVFDEVAITGCSSGSLTTDSSGAFSCGFSVPSGTLGTTVNATDAGGQSTTESFTVTTPAIAVGPAQGPVGSSFTAGGSGFEVSSEATVAFDGLELTATACSVGTPEGTRIVTDSSGAFSCTFTLPTEPGGNGTITATQGSNHVSASYLVTPSFTTSSGNGTVGKMVSVTGYGFGASDQYTLMWNSSTTLCFGSTNPSGEFTCSYLVPPAPAGLHTITALQGVSNFTSTFSVVPSFTISPSDVAVGTSVNVSGDGFDATARYTVSWNASTTLCSGTTNTNGGFTCTFVVPPSTVGSKTITTLEGSYAPTFSFTVAVSPPPRSSSSSPFPWWLVTAIVIVIAVLVIVALAYRYRGPRRAGHLVTAHPRRVTSPAEFGGAVQPWDGGAPSAGMPSPVPNGAVAAAPIASSATAAATELVPDIDELMARLERMSIQMFKKTPKELSQEPPVGESTETADGK
jgi:hypothetical protein